MPWKPWPIQAQETIDREIRSWCLEVGVRRQDVYRLPGERAEKLYNRINRAYPFGEKSGHPYKVWRRKLQGLRKALGLPPVRLTCKPTQEEEASSAGQLGIAFAEA